MPSDIRARLAAATGPDRETDSDILDHLNDAAASKTWPFEPGSYADAITPPLTASIDAAVALVARTLPGWAWSVGTCCVSDDAWLKPDYACPVHGARLCAEFGVQNIHEDEIPLDSGVMVERRPARGHVAIALIEALFKALEAKAALAKPGPGAVG